MVIISLIQDYDSITSEKIAEKISQKKPVSTRTIETDIAKLKEMGILKRKGGRKDGRWVVAGRTHSCIDNTKTR